MDKKNTSYKIGSGFSPFSPCSERFVTEGYREPLSLKEQMKKAGAIKMLDGIALDYPGQLKEKDIPEIKSLLSVTGQVLCTLEAGLYNDRKWKNGSISSHDPGIRKEAVELSKRTMDIASAFGSENVLLWTGQDGFDYPFQTDYMKAWDNLAGSISEIAAHRPEIRIGIEYKPKEPRTNLFIRNAGVLLSLIKEVGASNVGGVVDYGHSLVAGENPAEAAVLLARENKLFEVHLNDNFRDYDHDLVVGSVSFWETLEFFYWLETCNFKGWHIIDVFPYRENGEQALQESVNSAVYFMEAAKRLKERGLSRLLVKRDMFACKSLIEDVLLKKINGRQ